MLFLTNGLTKTTAYDSLKIQCTYYIRYSASLSFSTEIHQEITNGEKRTLSAPQGCASVDSIYPFRLLVEPPWCERFRSDAPDLFAVATDFSVLLKTSSNTTVVSR